MAGGVDRFWSDQLKGVGAIVNDKEEALDEIAVILAEASVEGWVATVEEATREDLKEGLKAIRSLAGLFKRLSEANAALLGDRDAFGFGVFEDLNLNEPRTIAAYVPLMLMLYRSGRVDERMDQMLAAGEQFSEVETLIAEASSEQLAAARRLASGLLITD